jgi:uncharacterized protein
MIKRIFLKPIKWFMVLWVMPLWSWAAVSFTGTTYTQNFDSLTILTTSQTWDNNSTLSGWYLFTASGTAITEYNAGTGSSNTGKFYSFGTNSDRALGGLGSGGDYFGSPTGGAVAGWIAFAATNDSGANIDSVVISFDGEQWRNGGNDTAQTMVLEYGFGASFDAVANWTAPGGNFDWTSPVATSTAAAVDGNVAGLVSNKGGTLSSLNWTNGSTLWIRWIENNDAGNDHGLAIDNFSLSITSTEPTITKIHTIQGSSAAVTDTTTTFIVEAIVTADYRSTLSGFFIQEEDADVDNDPATSEAIFVYCQSNCPATLAVGDKVQVTAKASEFQNMSQLLATTAGSVVVVSSNNALPMPTVVTLPVPVEFASKDEYLERFEGMIVKIAGTLTVTENYQLGRFGQVTLAAGTRPTQFTHLNAPSVSGYANHKETLSRRTLILDDHTNAQNPDPVIYPQNNLSGTNTLRSGSMVTDLTGVLHWSWGGHDSSPNNWRIRPTTPVTFNLASRPNTPPSVGAANVKVASFNVLNYFNTFGNNNCTGGVGGATMNCRGAENNTEFDRQKDKHKQVFIGLNADVIGLMELENDGYSDTSAQQDLLNLINGAGLSGRNYKMVDADTLIGDTNALGTDAIKVALIYDDNTMELVAGSVKTSTATIFERRPLAATFLHTATGEKFTVVVNHFKSKGSAGSLSGDADQNDGQGNSNATRVAQATALVAFLNTLTDDPDILVMGDLNAYAKEDPITTIKNAGYTDLLGGNKYSYVFDGQVGYLDHALASASLVPQVTGAEDWHINANEPSVLDYNTNFKTAEQITNFYAVNPFRSSDHDPVLIGLKLSQFYDIPPNTDGSGNTGGASTVFYAPPPQPDYFQLSIGSPNGRVYTSPAGIDCNKGQGVCSATFKRGQRISLNIQAPEGVIFAGWSGSNVCSRGSFNIYNSLNCNAIFYGDPNYVKEEVKQPETQPETNPSSNTGSISSEHPKTYIHSFSVRANIAAKSNCNLTQPQNPNEVAVAGFILRGIGSERVLINARGLEPGVEPKLLLKQTIIQPNGKLEAKDISENANWETHANAQNIPVAYRPKQTIDAALLMDLPAGIYTVTACMNQEAIIDSGVALVSVTPLDNKLSFSNASGRGFVGGGANDVIVGFTVLGTEQRQVQLRGRALGNSEANIIDTALKVGRIYFDPVSNSIKGEEISSIASQRAESVRQNRAAADDSSASVMMDFTPGSYTTVLSSESGKGGLGIVSVDFMD